MKKIFGIVIICLSLFGCSRDADVASRNLSTASDNFEIMRRVVFYNGITGDYILTIEGLCTRDNSSTQFVLGVVCKTNDGYKKHLFGLSDNVTFFMEQLDSKNVSVDHYKVIFKPSVIIPDIEMR